MDPSGGLSPSTYEAAKRIHKRGITIVPYVIANSGRVICAATEYQRLNKANAFDRVEAAISDNTAELLRRVASEALALHDVAQKMERERIDKAMSYRAHI